MADKDEAPIHRSRGKGFPTMALDEAASVVKQAGQYGRAHSLGAFAGYLGHGTTNSGPFRAKMAALKDWGLVQRRGDEVFLTDLANVVAHPESDEIERQSLRDAFRHADLFAAIYEDSAKGMDLNLDLIGNRAVTMFGVAARSKKRFAESFAKSATSAGLARMSSESTLELLAEGTEQSQAGGENGAPPTTTTTDNSGRAVGSPALEPSPSRDTPTLHQEWGVQGGTLAFEARLNSALPAGAYGHIAKIADAIEQLVRFLGAPEEDAGVLTGSSEEDVSE